MRLPAAAIIAPEKLRDYVLSPTHPDGRAKAAYLGRDCLQYEILGPLTGPNGLAAWVRTIWIIPSGENVARLVTLIPVEKR